MIWYDMSSTWWFWLSKFDYHFFGVKWKESTSKWHVKDLIWHRERSEITSNEKISLRCKTFSVFPLVRDRKQHDLETTGDSTVFNWNNASLIMFCLDYRLFLTASPCSRYLVQGSVEAEWCSVSFGDLLLKLVKEKWRLGILFWKVTNSFSIFNSENIAEMFLSLIWSQISSFCCNCALVSALPPPTRGGHLPDNRRVFATGSIGNGPCRGIREHKITPCPGHLYWNIHQVSYRAQNLIEEVNVETFWRFGFGKIYDCSRRFIKILKSRSYSGVFLEKARIWQPVIDFGNEKYTLIDSTFPKALTCVCSPRGFLASLLLPCFCSPLSGCNFVAN